MGKGQCLTGLHVGWIKSPLGLVAGGPGRAQALLGQLPMSSPSHDHRAQILWWRWGEAGGSDSIFLWEERAGGHWAFNQDVPNSNRLLMFTSQTS